MVFWLNYTCIHYLIWIKFNIFQVLFYKSKISKNLNILKCDFWKVLMYIFP